MIKHNFPGHIYQEFFDLSHDMVCIAGMDGYFKKINKAFENTLGYPESELLSHPFMEFIHEEDREKTLFEMDKLQHGEKSVNFENRYLTKDGQYKLLEWTAIPFLQDKISFAVCRDITERNRSQEMFLEIILDNIPDMIFVKEAKDLKFVRFNKAGEELLGYSKDKLIGKNDYDFFPKEQAAFFISKDRSVLAGGKLLDIPEEPINTAQKGERILHTKKIPIYDSQGNAQYLVGISEDITDKKKAEVAREKMNMELLARKEAEKTIKLREEFISIASHELKTPLSSLKLHAQMFQLKIKKGAEDIYSKLNVDHFVQQVEIQASRLNRLVEDMLDVSRIRTGKLTMEWEEFDLKELVTDILERMREPFNAAQCGTPVFACEEKKFQGTWDKMRIEQVLTNLLTNAIRYGEGSPIRIELSSNGKEVLICVRDQGIGIAEEDKKKIFNRFERAMETGDVRGLGLGLFIAEQIVDAHKGKIWVESELRRGSSFYVQLPVSHIN